MHLGLIENPTYEKQFHIIEGLMQQADEIINCGDEHTGKKIKEKATWYKTK